jgi:hypothetical protein
MSIYNLIFNSNKLSFDEKVEKACEFANHRVEMKVNSNLIEAYKGFSIYSECEVTRFKEKDNKWVTERIFYYGDISHIDFKNDWRTKEVKNMRKQLIFKGLCCIKKRSSDGLKNSSKNIIKYLQQENNINRFSEFE